MSQDADSSTNTGPVEKPRKGNLVTVDGVKFSKNFESNRPMKEHIDCLRTLEMRDDDIVICAYTKSGTHWLWEIASMLISGKAEYEKRTKEFAMMEAIEIESLQSQPSPRVLNTHVPIQMLPAQIKDKKVKLIHLYRNPKDVAVSLYHHRKQVPVLKDITVEDMIRDYIIDEGKGGYVTYLQSMAKFMEEIPDHAVFNLSFEELKEDTEGTIRRLGEFLGVKTTPELCADITQATSLSNMKQADNDKMHIDRLSGKQFYRKGIVGDWKNHLTVAQSEAVDAKMKELEGCGKFHFRYTL